MGCQNNLRVPAVGGTWTLGRALRYFISSLIGFTSVLFMNMFQKAGRTNLGLIMRTQLPNRGIGCSLRIILPSGFGLGAFGFGLQASAVLTFHNLQTLNLNHRIPKYFSFRNLVSRSPVQLFSPLTTPIPRPAHPETVSPGTA